MTWNCNHCCIDLNIPERMRKMSRKWYKTDDALGDAIDVVLFVSRNKDNRDVEGFKERREAFVTTRTPEQLTHEFDGFVSRGVKGEFCRMYISVNPRSNTKTFKAIQHKMLDGEFNLAVLPAKVAAVAAKKENSYYPSGKTWLFDFDPVEHGNTYDAMLAFVDDLQQYISEDDISVHHTPNGYAILTTKHFDPRELLDKWSNVSLKRDEMLCVKWDTTK